MLNKGHVPHARFLALELIKFVGNINNEVAPFSNKHLEELVLYKFKTNTVLKKAIDLLLNLIIITKITMTYYTIHLLVN